MSAVTASATALPMPGPSLKAGMTSESEALADRRPSMDFEPLASRKGRGKIADPCQWTVNRENQLDELLLTSRLTPYGTSSGIARTFAARRVPASTSGTVKVIVRAFLGAVGTASNTAFFELHKSRQWPGSVACWRPTWWCSGSQDDRRRNRSRSSRLCFRAPTYPQRAAGRSRAWIRSSTWGGETFVALVGNATRFRFSACTAGTCRRASGIGMSQHTGEEYGTSVRGCTSPSRASKLLSWAEVSKPSQQLMWLLTSLWCELEFLSTVATRRPISSIG